MEFNSKKQKKKSQQECYGIFLKKKNIVSQRERHGGDGYIDLPKFNVYDAIYDRHQELNKSQTASHLDHGPTKRLRSKSFAAITQTNVFLVGQQDTINKLLIKIIDESIIFLVFLAVSRIIV